MEFLIEEQYQIPIGLGKNVIILTDDGKEYIIENIISEDEDVIEIEEIGQQITTTITIIKNHITSIKIISENK
ncbi:hypothetical protein ACJJAK_02065 [Staphylococcus equorum]|uniref:hypothetical protein n=1 Tax=Staphylococcus equorum TaxID=246432 RepID=UPI00403FDF5E